MVHAFITIVDWIPATRCRPITDAPPLFDSERCRSVGDRYSAMRPHLASSPPAALASSAEAGRVLGRHTRPPDVVWTLTQLTY